MSNQNYTATISVDQSPKEAFEAIRNVRGWWSEEIVGSTAKTEWKGTKVVFDIAKEGDETVIHFTHEGLVRAYECYSVCSDAWGTYIRGSLKSLIATGKGSPNPRESAEKV